MFDQDYVSRIGHLLPKLKRTRLNPGEWWCRCPYCGDSKKDPNKLRGHLRQSREDPSRIFFKCYNCDISRSLRTLIRDLDPDTYRDYMREQRSGRLRDTPVVPASKSLDPMTRFPLPEDYFDPIYSSAKALAYLKSRMIPESALRRLWFTDRFKETVHAIDKEKYTKNRDPESRVIFPMMTVDGSRMIGFQGRAIDPENPLRYVMIMMDRSAPRFYGMETIDTSMPVRIVEGPVDSLFLRNCVASCSATNNSTPPFKNTVWFLDQEPRNTQVVSKIRSLIDSGQSVVILPREYHERDVNELVLSGMSSDQLESLVNDNTFSGLRARVALAAWTH